MRTLKVVLFQHQLNVVTRVLSVEGQSCLMWWRLDVTCAKGSDPYSNSPPLEGLAQTASLVQNLSKLIQPMTITPSPRSHLFSSVSACLILSHLLDYLNSLRFCLLSPKARIRFDGDAQCRFSQHVRLHLHIPIHTVSAWTAGAMAKPLYIPSALHRAWFINIWKMSNGFLLSLLWSRA